MGVRRLFSRGGQKISRGGGQDCTFCLKNNKKDTIPQKKSKNILFLAGKSPPCHPHADAHGHSNTYIALGPFKYHVTHFWPI